MAAGHGRAGVPRTFADAYGALVGLVRAIADDEENATSTREAVDRWRREECRGAKTLCDAAVAALEYELAARCLHDPRDEEAHSDREALGRVREVLDPPEARAEGPDAAVVEVALPQELVAAMERSPGRLVAARGFRMGRLQIIFEVRREEGRDANTAHLSVSHPSRYPTFEELMAARHAPGGPAPDLWALVPRTEGRPPGSPAARVVHLYDVPPQGFPAGGEGRRPQPGPERA